MIAVIFQVTMKGGKASEYFDLAAELRPALDGRDGFISIERFESVSTPGKFLSLSFWRDEEAIKSWREHADHMLAQDRGKAEIFADFRISVADVKRDYTMADRAADRVA